MFDPNNPHMPQMPDLSQAEDYVCERCESPIFDTVMIVKGEGGSDRIKKILGKQVSVLLEVDCYRREIPRYSEIPDLESVGENGLSAWTATSSEIVHNIFSIFNKNQQKWLRSTPIFVTHPRISLVAQCYGVREIIITVPGNANIVSSLRKWFQ